MNNYYLGSETQDLSESNVQLTKSVVDIKPKLATKRVKILADENANMIVKEDSSSLSKGPRFTPFKASNVYSFIHFGNIL